MDSAQHRLIVCANVYKVVRETEAELEDNKGGDGQAQELVRGADLLRL